MSDLQEAVERLHGIRKAEEVYSRGFHEQSSVDPQPETQDHTEQNDTENIEDWTHLMARQCHKAHKVPEVSL